LNIQYRSLFIKSLRSTKEITKGMALLGLIWDSLGNVMLLRKWQCINL